MVVHVMAPTDTPAFWANWAAARFCLGRYWRSATEAQQGEYTELFHRVLVSSVTSKVGDYRGDTFTIGHSIQRADGSVVPTVLTRPGNAPGWGARGRPVS